MVGLARAPGVRPTHELWRQVLALDAADCSTVPMQLQLDGADAAVVPEAGQRAQAAPDKDIPVHPQHVLIRLARGPGGGRGRPRAGGGGSGRARSRTLDARLVQPLAMIPPDNVI